MKWLASTAVFILLLSGCAGRQEFMPPAPDTAEFAPPALDYSLPATQHGSLYRHQYAMTLFQDRRAYRVGDMLTVVLDEETQSSKRANTKFAKDASMTVDVPFIAGNSTDMFDTNIAANRDFDGAAASSQGNKLEGAITVTVHKVLPNGALVIRGEKWIRLNQGDEFIRLTGVVRVDDVDRHNQVSSLRIGDARITYSGRGVLADSNAAGWLTQFFSSPWVPF